MRQLKENSIDVDKRRETWICDNRWLDGENLEIVGIRKQETGGQQEHTRTL